ncbi:hypothetical protein K492DRAFT_202422 [Lichtheimia hyalospora FSU 10163]|nr:hypothetical protein K492DRAFT_202422 [Lichtheimia hyalospora FSU 10163]
MTTRHMKLPYIDYVMASSTIETARAGNNGGNYKGIHKWAQGRHTYIKSPLSLYDYGDMQLLEEETVIFMQHEASNAITISCLVM